jgi:hypothetical protein
VTFIAKLVIVPRVPWSNLGDHVAIVGLGWKFWGLVTIPDEQPEASWTTRNEREKRDPSSSYFLERASTTTFYFPFL